MENIVRAASGFISGFGRLLSSNPSPDKRDEVDEFCRRSMSTGQAKMSYESSGSGTFDGEPLNMGAVGKSLSWAVGHRDNPYDTGDASVEPSPGAVHHKDVRVFAVAGPPRVRKKSHSHEPGTSLMQRGGNDKKHVKFNTEMLYDAQDSAERNRQKFEAAATELVRRQRAGVCGLELRKLQDNVDEKLWRWCRHDREATRLSKREWMQKMEGMFNEGEEEEEDPIEKFLREQGGGKGAAEV